MEPGVLRSHWEELEDWPPGRALYACYVTLADQAALQDVCREYRRDLEELSTLDLILPSWLHLTVQGVRFVDELDSTRMTQVASRLERWLHDAAPFTVRAERPVVGTDAVFLPIRPAAPLAALRDSIRTSLLSDSAAEPLYTLPGQADSFDPHVSIAYANAPTSADEVEQALHRCAAGPVEMTIREVSMIRLHRAERTYRWSHEHPIALHG